jgi:hypothetical protein
MPPFGTTMISRTRRSMHARIAFAYSPSHRRSSAIVHTHLATSPASSLPFSSLQPSRRPSSIRHCAVVSRLPRFSMRTMGTYSSPASVSGPRSCSTKLASQSIPPTSNPPPPSCPPSVPQPRRHVLEPSQPTCLRWRLLHLTAMVPKFCHESAPYKLTLYLLEVELAGTPTPRSTALGTS